MAKNIFLISSLEYYIKAPKFEEGQLDFNGQFPHTTNSPRKPDGVIHESVSNDDKATQVR